MEETSAKLAELGNDIKNAEIPMWTGLPMLELYMDQVIILLNSYMRIIKDENGEIVCLYIQSLKTAKLVAIRADDNLELILPQELEQYGGHNLAASNNLDIQRKA